MVATNDILPFASTDTGTNLESQADYATDDQRSIGNQPGVARSPLVNKVLRQTSFVTTAVAQAASDLTGDDINDDGDLAALIATLKKAIKSAGVRPGVPYFWLGKESEVPVDDSVLELYGQAVSRTAYPILFQHYGTIHGAGNGTTTFNLPDMRGIGPIGKDDMGGSAASRVTSGVSGINATVIGTKGGDQRVQTHNHAATVTDPGHHHTLPYQVGFAAGAGGSAFEGTNTTDTSTEVTGITVSNAAFGAGSSQNMQPSIVGLWVTNTGN